MVCCTPACPPVSDANLMLIKPLARVHPIATDEPLTTKVMEFNDSIR